MGTRVAPTSGVVVFDEHFLDTTYLAANTAAATTSDYTEADPQPGRVTHVSGQSLVPVVTNAQDDTTVEVRVQRAGFAGRAGLAYRIDGATWRGWNGVKPIGWEGVGGLYTTTDDWSVYAVAVVPSTQLMVIVYAEYDTGSVYCRTRAHDTESWSSAVEVTTNSAKGLGLVVTPDESLVMVRMGSNQRISTMRSGDGGATWSVLARAEDVGLDLGIDPGQTATPGSAFDVALVGDTQLLGLVTPALGDTLQFASPDLGITWSLVDGAVDEPSSLTALRCARASDGSVFVAYLASSTTMEVRRFANAFQRFSAASTGTAVTVTGASSYALAVDADDTLYLVTYDDDSGVHLGKLHVSTDYGTTWSTSTIYDGASPDAVPGDADLTNLRIAAAAGRLWLFHQHEGVVAAAGGSLTALKLASWSSAEWDDAPDVTWLPIAEPDDVSWTATGTGTPTMTLAHLRVVTAADTRYYQYNGTGHSLTPALHVIMACTVGASSSAAAGAQVTATTAGATYVMRALLWDDTLQIRDNIAGTSIVEVAVTGANDLEVMMWFTGAAAGRAAYKLPNDVDWTVIPEVTAHTFSDGGALESNCWVRIGVLSSATVTAWYRFASFYEGFGGVNTGTAQIGKRLSSFPYPIPGVLDADDRMAHLSVRGGLGLTSESYQVAPAHTYALEHAFVGLHPDPVSREWRSVNDDDEVIVAFDLEGSTYIGGALAVHLDGCNFRTAYLEYHDGSAWQTLATYDGAVGFSALQYYRDGATLYPDPTSTPDSGRQLQEMELARSIGGFAIIDDGLGGTEYARRVCSNTGGWWTLNTTARAVVNVDGITGSEPSSGEVTLVAPGGLLVAYLTSFTPRRRWRVRIPAQITVDGFFRLGTGFSIGRVIPFGLGWGWGAAGTRTAQYDSQKDAAGVETRSSRGADIRTWTVDWSAGVPMEVPRQDVDGDYVGVSGGLALEPVHATPWQLAGIFDRTNGQTVPVVAVAQLPATTSTITDRTLYLYGLPSNSLGTSIASGTEGTNEVVRTETVRVDGYPGG
jgi:hypothetical protein